jgi:hypothetical protein
VVFVKALRLDLKRGKIEAEPIAQQVVRFRQERCGAIGLVDAQMGRMWWTPVTPGSLSSASATLMRLMPSGELSMRIDSESRMMPHEASSRTTPKAMPSSGSMGRKPVK